MFRLNSVMAALKKSKCIILKSDMKDIPMVPKLPLYRRPIPFYIPPSPSPSSPQPPLPPSPKTSPPPSPSSPVPPLPPLPPPTLFGHFYKLGSFVTSFEYLALILAFGWVIWYYGWKEGKETIMSRFDPRSSNQILEAVKRLEVKAANINENVEKVEQGVAKIDEKVEKVEKRMAKIDEKLKKLEERVAKIDEKLEKEEEMVAKKD